MRYKGTFRPQYVLGKPSQSPSTPVIDNQLTNNNVDPESLTWDPLDGVLSQKLDQRPYVSLSRDRKTEAEPSNSPAKEEEEEADIEINDEEVSLFDLHVPGVLTVEEVKALDLDHWLLLVRGTFVHMIVSSSSLFLVLVVLVLTGYRILWDGRKCP